MRDSFGRSIEYLRVSLTDLCNLRCVYCMPAEGVQRMCHEDILRIEEIERAVRIACELGVRHVRFTGGEPLVRRGCVGLVREVAANPRIEDVSLTTNGILLPRFASELREAGLSRVNISLDTLDAQQYREVTRLGNLDDALAGVEAALAAGFDPVKVNAVAVRSLHQDFWAFARMTLERPLHVRFIEYMPVGDGCWGAEDVVPAAEIIDAIDAAARAAGAGALEPVRADESPAGVGPAQYFRLPGAQGTVGFIHAMSNHFCATCNRLRLTADGKLRPCLFSDAEYDVREALRNGTDDEVAAVFAAAVGGKPDAKHDKVGTERRMSQIGG